MSASRWLSLAGASAVLACGEAMVAPTDRLPDEPLLAKGGPPAAQSVDFTITGGTDLVSDGKGTYRDGTCGVVGTWSSSGSHLAPAEGKIPRAQQASCAGIAPRAATVTLALRHVSDSPHIDDAAAPAGGGTFNVGNVKFGFGSAQATTINAGGSTPFCGTLGLRFTSVTFPGTSDVVRDDLGGGLWHMYTRPWPDNIGYCENGGVVAYWHVAFDLYQQVR